jgi:hypothetical protein
MLCAGQEYKFSTTRTKINKQNNVRVKIQFSQNYVIYISPNWSNNSKKLSEAKSPTVQLLGLIERAGSGLFQVNLTIHNQHVINFREMVFGCTHL